MRILNSNLSASDRKPLYPLDFDTKGIPMTGRLGKGRPAIITKNEKEFSQMVILLFWQRRSDRRKFSFSLKSQFSAEKRNHSKCKLKSIRYTVLSIGVRGVTRNFFCYDLLSVRIVKFFVSFLNLHQFRNGNFR